MASTRIRPSLALAVIWIICSVAVAQVQLPEQFSWDVILDSPAFPTFNFTTATIDREVTFQYSYTGTVSPGTKYFEATVLAGDCLAGVAETNPEALQIKFENVDAEKKKYIFNIDIVQSLIQDSSYWTDNGDNTADMVFCVRVDYLNVNESVNFHETIVTVTIDLSAGFQATNILTERSAAMETNLQADADYTVIAYYCDASNQPIPDDPVFSQGDVMEVCIRIDDDLNEEEIYVKDILNLNIIQYDNGSGPPADPTAAILNGVPDPLTIYDCGTDGRCYMMHQLTSKFFEHATPGTLEVNGAALLSFGNPAGRRGRQRFLQANIRGSLSAPSNVQHDARALDEDFVISRVSGGSISEFVLVANLDDLAVNGATEDTDSNAILIISAVIGSLIAVILLVATLLIRRVRKDDEEDYSISEEGEYSEELEEGRYDMNLQPAKPYSNKSEGTRKTSSNDSVLSAGSRRSLGGIIERLPDFSESPSSESNEESSMEDPRDTGDDASLDRRTQEKAEETDDYSEGYGFGIADEEFDDHSMNMDELDEEGILEVPVTMGDSKCSLDSSGWGSFNSLEGLI